MHPNQAAVQMFLKAQESRDPVRLSHALHPECTLREPIAGELSGIHVFAWWQMLWRFRNHTVSIVKSAATPTGGSASWKLSYTHPETRRALLLNVESEFEFKQNKIVAQRDRYSVYGYLRQVMGTPGKFFGWFPPLHWSVRAAATERLGAFEEKHNITEGNHLLGPVHQKKRGDSIPDMGDISFERSNDL